MFERMKDGTIQVQRDEYYDWYERESDLMNLLWFLETENTDLVQYGGGVSMGNFDGGFKLYDCYNDCYYIVSYSECEQFKNNEVITLYPREMDNDERVQYERERGGDEYFWKTRIVTDVLWDGEQQVENDGYDLDDVVVYDYEPIDRFVEILRKDFSWKLNLSDDNVTVENNGDIVEVFENGILKAYFMPY